MNALIVQGVLFGDEGKGALVDYLCRQRPDTALVVRYGGGAQCAHTVVTPDNRTHTFSQFGSGTLAGIGTYLSEFVRVRPDWIIEESKELQALGVNNPLSMLTVNENCLITTIYHQIASERAAGIHQRGTCGVGVGQTVAYAATYPDDALYMRDMNDRAIVAHKLILMKIRLAIGSIAPLADVATDDLMMCCAQLRICTNRHWIDHMRDNGTVIFEGHQGALLDKDMGFKPYVTSSDCTYRQADMLLEGYTGVKEYYAVMRSYATRHGAGDLPTETDKLYHLAEPHNATGMYQGVFRRGWFDLDLVNRGLSTLDSVGYRQIKLAVSHMDYVSQMNGGAGWQYRWNGKQHSHLTGWKGIENLLKHKVAYLGFGARSTEWQST